MKILKKEESSTLGNNLSLAREVLKKNTGEDFGYDAEKWEEWWEYSYIK